MTKTPVHATGHSKKSYRYLHNGCCARRVEGKENCTTGSHDPKKKKMQDEQIEK